MKNEYGFEDMTEEQFDGCLTESDFYPPSDDRKLKSNVKDIIDGDNFTDYCAYIFDLLDEEEYYD